MGVPRSVLEWGEQHPPPPNGGQSEHITFPHHSDAGGNNVMNLCIPAQLYYSKSRKDLYFIIYLTVNM